MQMVKTRLQTLPHKLTHPTQVPVGVQAPGTPPLVLLNGHLKHTNEVLVLIGDNWFVERTAKQSIDILERRIGKTSQIINDFKKEKDNHEKWIDTVQGMQQEDGQLVDVREEFDEEAEKQWRKHHRDKVRQEKIREREDRQRSKRQDDREIARRIEQLELAEEGESRGGTGSGDAATSQSSTPFTGVISERPTAPLEARHLDPVTGRVSKFAASRKHL